MLHLKAIFFHLIFRLCKFGQKIWRPKQMQSHWGWRQRLPSCWNLCCGIKTALNHPLSTFSLGNFLAGNKKVLSLLLAKRYFVGEEERSSGAHLIIHFGISSLPLALPSQGYFSDWYGRQLTISNLAWFPIKSVKPFSELQEILQSIPYKMIT